MADTNLNAAQLQHIQNEASKALQAAVDKMQLRKWAVEQAITFATSLNSLPFPRLNPEGNSGATVAGWNNAIAELKIHNPMPLATAVYDFVSQAAAVRVDITGGGK